MADEWFYTQQGQQQGPVGAAQLKQLASAGRLLPTDLVWKEGMANWAPASAVRGLFAQAPGSSVMTPVPGRARGSGGAPSSRRQANPPTPMPPPARPRPGPIAVTPIDEEDDAPLPGRLPRKSGSLSPRAWIAIIGGSVGALVLIAVVVLLLVLLSGRNAYSTDLLLPAQHDNHQVWLEAGRLAQITVRSDPASKLDVLVFDPMNRPEKHSPYEADRGVRFLPKVSGEYRIELVNLGPNASRFRVTYRQ